MGKTTQAALLVAALKARGAEVLAVREPGGTALGEHLRPILKNPDIPMRREAQGLLFMAARAQLVHEVVLPALARGCYVVCDRFTLSTRVYQVARLRSDAFRFYEQGRHDDARDSERLADLVAADCARWDALLLGRMDTVVLQLDFADLEARLGARKADGADRFEAQVTSRRDTWSTYAELGVGFAGVRLHLTAAEDDAAVHARILDALDWWSELG